MLRNVRGWMLCQSKVPTETMIITATSAAIGISPTTSPSTTTRISRKTPARNVEIRVRAPDTLTLIIVWPIIAQPPMPPKKPVTTLATPWPQPSRVLLRVRVGDVVDELRGHQRLQQADERHGECVRGDDRRVCKVNGTSGSTGMGRRSGSAPSSPTVGTLQPKTVTTR